MQTHTASGWTAWKLQALPNPMTMRAREQVKNDSALGFPGVFTFRHCRSVNYSFDVASANLRSRDPCIIEGRIPDAQKELNCFCELITGAFHSKVPGCAFCKSSEWFECKYLDRASIGRRLKRKWFLSFAFVWASLDWANIWTVTLSIFIFWSWQEPSWHLKSLFRYLTQNLYSSYHSIIIYTIIKYLFRYFVFICLKKHSHPF